MFGEPQIPPHTNRTANPLLILFLHSNISPLDRTRSNGEWYFSSSSLPLIPGDLGRPGRRQDSRALLFFVYYFPEEKNGFHSDVVARGCMFVTRKGDIFTTLIVDMSFSIIFWYFFILPQRASQWSLQGHLPGSKPYFHSITFTSFGTFGPNLRYTYNFR